MAPRSFWRGYLKLSLVTCPVTMAPATSESGKVRFHTLNARTGNRVVSRYVDAVTARPVPDEDQARGYPRGEDEFVLLEDDELDSIALESTRTIDIEMFVPADSIGWIWYDTPHYLAPADRIGEEAFSVIREAMADTGMVGIARLVLYRRERAVMLEPRGRGIVVWTLRYGDELRDPRDYFDAIAPEKPAAAAMALMKQLIREHTRDWDPGMATDPVQERLLEIIAAKKKRQKRPARARTAAEPPDNVVNIMDALKRSLAAERKK
ncbi:Ku protein [Paracoccus sp. SJTW-4]|uniref:non-homologous end joining protein Ku n=1 Tax=Paracoccus sp. SJTW-4 TaxID=3078428 RepID=UPI0039ECE2BE